MYGTGMQVGGVISTDGSKDFVQCDTYRLALLLQPATLSQSMIQLCWRVMHWPCQRVGVRVQEPLHL